METTAQAGVAPCPASRQPDLMRLQLKIGSETVDVRVGLDGLRFSDPHAPSTEGVLLWDEAIALALLPHRVRLCRGAVAGGDRRVRGL
jgi:hypothetical protein